MSMMRSAFLNHLYDEKQIPILARQFHDFLNHLYDEKPRTK